MLNSTPPSKIAEWGQALLETADDGEASLAAGELRNLLNEIKGYHPEIPVTRESALRKAGFKEDEIKEILRRIEFAETTT